MPKGSKELTEARRQEIISACEKLYATMSFKEITLKEIGAATTFTRTSIYNYFRTKEEIFLALVKQEYELWISSLEKLQQDHAALSKDEFAEALARSLEERPNLLKLLAMNHYDIEENSRMERLVEFKVSYGRALNEVRSCLQQFFPAMGEAEREVFIYSFFPFMFGIYPYTVVTDKQREAMDMAHVQYAYITIHDLVYNQVRRLLGD